MTSSHTKHTQKCALNLIELLAYNALNKFWVTAIVSNDGWKGLDVCCNNKKYWIWLNIASDVL